jgi:hypothetical protein
MTTKILIKFPTRERPEKFFQVLNLYYQKSKDINNIEFLISCDSDDSTMNNPVVIKKLENAKKHINLNYYFGNSKSKVEAINSDIEKIKNWDILLLASDDMIPVCDEYDQIIRDDMLTYYKNGDGVLWYNDGNRNDLITLCIFDKKYYEKFNYIYNPEYTSLWCDNEFTDVCLFLKKCTKINKTIIEHAHPAYQKANFDKLYVKNESFFKKDEDIYNKRKIKNFDLCIDICTVADSKYFLQGLTLFESIKQKSSISFKFHFLCINEEDYLKHKDKYENIIFYNAKDFLDKSKLLYNHYINDYRYFCWSLASFFSYFLLKYENKNSVIYIDSDICFYKDIKILYEKIKNKDCAIFRHRQFSLNENRMDGLFNVGVVYFNNTPNGVNVLGWWADAVLNKKYPHLATCGDQKYLEAFPQIVGEDNIFIDGDIGHGAPWMWQLYDLSKINDGYITWNGEKQEYYFSHFSQFSYDIENNKFKHSTLHEPYTNNNQIFTNPVLDQHYKEYFNIIKQTKNKYNL